MSHRRILAAGILTVALVTVSYGGTITGSRTSASGARVGTITGSRAGTITGSRAGTITGSRTGTITGSRVRTPLSELQEDFLSRVVALIVSVGW